MKIASIVIVFLVMVSCPAWAENIPVYDDRPKITVYGDALVQVKPDKIIITFGIETLDMDIVAANKKYNEILNSAISSIRESGIPEKEIQSDYLSIKPKFKSGFGVQDDFNGYVVKNKFLVTVTGQCKVEDLITNVLKSGVNNIFDIDFQTTELKKYREQTRELALEAAKEKAVKMAAVLGQSIGTPIQIDEISEGPYRYSNSNISQNIPTNFVGANYSDITDTATLGQISIRSKVAVTFELMK